MIRKIIAGTALAGALTLGMAGAAGAATAPTGTTGTTAITPSTTVCSLLPNIEARVHKVEARLAAELPKAQAAEAKAKAAGHTVHQSGVAIDGRLVAGRRAGEAVAGKIEGDDPVVAAEPRHPRLPGLQGGGVAVDHDDGWAPGISLIAVVQAHAAGQVHEPRGAISVFGLELRVGNIGPQ